MSENHSVAEPAVAAEPVAEESVEDQEAAPTSLTDSDAPPPPLPWPFGQVRLIEDELLRLARIQALMESEKLAEISDAPFSEADVARIRRERETLERHLEKVRLDCAEIVRGSAHPQALIAQVQHLDRLHARHRWVTKMRESGMLLPGDRLDGWFRKTARELHRLANEA